MAEETAATTTTDTTSQTAGEIAKTEVAATTTADAGKTIVEGQDDGVAVAVQATWPDDWRAKLAGEDKADLKTLERMGSPVDLWKANKALRQKISAGELKSAFPADGDDKAKAAWRKENGLPPDESGYKPDLPDGVVIGEADKPLIESFSKAAFTANFTPAQFNQALAWYYDTQDQALAKLQEADDQFHATAEDELRAEWGPNWHRERNAVMNLLQQAPEGVADRLIGGRTADGKLIGDDPAVLRWLAQLSREVNPTATLVPAGTANPGKAVGDRLAELNKMMGDQRSDYWRGPNAAALQAEYRELLDAQDKMKARAA